MNFFKNAISTKFIWIFLQQFSHSFIPAVSSFQCYETGVYRPMTVSGAGGAIRGSCRRLGTLGTVSCGHQMGTGLPPRAPAHFQRPRCVAAHDNQVPTTGSDSGMSPARTESESRHSISKLERENVKCYRARCLPDVTPRRRHATICRGKWTFIYPLGK